jgi:hypothetical protein
MLLDDPELWSDCLTFLWECHASRKRDRTTEDGTFLLHKKGAITSTFTGDWLLTEGESRDKLTARNRTSVICAKRCGYRGEDSPQSQTTGVLGLALYLYQQRKKLPYSLD